MTQEEKKLRVSFKYQKNEFKNLDFSKKFNIVYGINRSGKSTISRFFLLPNTVALSECQVDVEEWQGFAYDSQNISDIIDSCGIPFVFDREFRDGIMLPQNMDGFITYHLPERFNEKFKNTLRALKKNADDFCKDEKLYNNTALLEKYNTRKQEKDYLEIEKTIQDYSKKHDKICSIVNKALKEDFNIKHKVIKREFHMLENTINDLERTVPLKKILDGNLPGFDYLPNLGSPYTIIYDIIDNHLQLSEGEKNIIALLLYCALIEQLHLNGEESAKKFTLIIDDPTSSLDDIRTAQIYEYIANFINQNNKQINKIIILTHRFDAIKRFSRLAKEKNLQISKLTSYTKNEIILEAYDHNNDHNGYKFINRYNFLFAQLLRASEKGEQKYLIEQGDIILQCRQLLEMFISLFYNETSISSFLDKIKQKNALLSNNTSISLLSIWLHEDIHSLDPFGGDDLLYSKDELIKATLQTLKALQPEHCIFQEELSEEEQGNSENILEEFKRIVRAISKDHYNSRLQKNEAIILETFCKDFTSKEDKNEIEALYNNMMLQYEQNIFRQIENQLDKNDFNTLIKNSIAFKNLADRVSEKTSHKPKV